MLCTVALYMCMYCFYIELEFADSIKEGDGESVYVIAWTVWGKESSTYQRKANLAGTMNCPSAFLQLDTMRCETWPLHSSVKYVIMYIHNHKYKSANGEAGAQLDYAVENHQTAYFDRIFNPFAESFTNSTEHGHFHPWYSLQPKVWVR